jgi:hypothetical protein
MTFCFCSTHNHTQVKMHTHRTLSTSLVMKKEDSFPSNANEIMFLKQ